MGAKVAVIDNDSSVLDAMQALLERWTCDVFLLRAIAEIEGLIKWGFQPDILLVDYHLDGGACGLAAVDRLRAASDRALPVIVITADHSPEIADKARSSGCEILLKPVKPAELRALMLHLVSRAGKPFD
jgi:CheY-like chemotaxis protein